MHHHKGHTIWKISVLLILTLFAYLSWVPQVKADSIRFTTGMAGLDPIDTFTFPKTSWRYVTVWPGGRRTIGFPGMLAANNHFNGVIPLYCTVAVDAATCDGYGTQFLDTPDVLLVGDNSADLLSPPVRSYLHGLTYDGSGALACTTVENKGCYNPISFGNPDIGPNTFLAGIVNTRMLACSQGTFSNIAGNANGASCPQMDFGSQLITHSTPTAPTIRQNAEVISGANAAVAITVAAVVNRLALLTHVEARCDAGAATLTITDNAVQIWSTSAGEVTTVNFFRDFAISLTSQIVNTQMVITLGPCGVGNIGTLMAQTGNM